MDFSSFLEFLTDLQNEKWETKTEKPFDYTINENSVTFTPQNGVGKPIGFEKLERFFKMYYFEGKKERKHFTNNTGKSINGRATYFLPIFSTIEKYTILNG